MTSIALSPDDYVNTLPPERQEAVQQLRDTLRQHLPQGFQEGMSYGMICFGVPHSIYPAGYHCNPATPLPFISVASQKNFIALYHMGIYADSALMDWFTAAWPEHTSTKLDMGKSCIRFKKPEAIPYALIGQLAEKMTPQEWIAVYENAFRRKAV